MTEPVRLRLHVSEPFDFERTNESADLFGITRDHHDDENDEWQIELEGSFLLGEDAYDNVMIAPRYVGEHLGRVFDALLGQPVRIAHRTDDGWQYSMTGMISLAPVPVEEPPVDDHDKNDLGFDKD